MMRPLFSSAMFFIVPCLGGCESISRISDLDPRSSSPTSSSISPVSPTPTPNVTTQELPPPPSRFPSGQQPGVAGAQQTAPDGTLPPLGAPSVAGSQLPGGVAAPAAGDLTLPATGQQKVASATPGQKRSGISAPVEAPAAPERPSQSRLTGGWSLAQGSGGKCKLILSNAPALDLYKAQTSGCSTGLTKVNAWELRGDEIYLYEQGGGVAARLKQSGNSSFNGAAAKSGAPISISK